MCGDGRLAPKITFAFILLFARFHHLPSWVTSYSFLLIISTLSSYDLWCSYCQIPPPPPQTTHYRRSLIIEPSNHWLVSDYACLHMHVLVSCIHPHWIEYITTRNKSLSYFPGDQIFVHTWMTKWPRYSFTFGWQKNIRDQKVHALGSFRFDTRDYWLSLLGIKGFSPMFEYDRDKLSVSLGSKIL